MRIFIFGLLLALCGPATMAVDDRTAAGLQHMVKRVVEERVLPGEAERTLVSEADYDMVGNLRTLRRYQDGKHFDEEVCAYAPTGLMSECAIYDGQRQLQQRNTFNYDTLGRVTGITEWQGVPSCPPPPLRTFTYNNAGRLAAIERWSGGEGYLCRQSFIYNAHGHLVTVTTVDTDVDGDFRSTETRQIDVDTQGRPKLETNLIDGKVIGRTLTLYDARGQVSLLSREEAGEPPVQEYSVHSYDRMGNWITRTTYRILPGKATLAETFVLADTTYRTISYYQ